MLFEDTGVAEDATVEMCMDIFTNDYIVKR